MKNKFLPKDYKEELAKAIEEKNFSQDAENLLLSMCYKMDDSYTNYRTVKREVPSKEEFMEKLVLDVELNCKNIIIAKPNSELEKELKQNQRKIKMDGQAEKNIISYPNEKTLAYAIAKASLPAMKNEFTDEDRAVITAINIGKCISESEVIRDFSGWTWSILSNEIESTECNTIYVFLSFLLGYKALENINLQYIKENLTESFYKEMQKVAMQFYLSYDKDKNEEILKKLSEDKKKLEKMKDSSKYIIEITKEKKETIDQIKQIDRILSDPLLMRQEYLIYNSNKPDKEKVFSVSHYQEKLTKDRQKLLYTLSEYNRIENPNEFLKEREKLEYEIKFYEEETDISKLEKEFKKIFIKKLEKTNERRELLNIIYEIRYLNFLPNCKMNLNEIEEKAVPKAIKYHVLEPISNNDILDYRILKGIFDSDVISLENLYIKLSSSQNIINVELYEGDTLEKKYDITLPDGVNIQIRRSKKMKIFAI